MKYFTVAAVAALASFAAAQDLLAIFSSIPSCAQTCLLAPIASDGCADPNDFKCHCEKSDQLIQAGLPCVNKECKPDDVKKSLDAVQQLCNAVGVPVNFPNQPAPSQSLSSTVTGTPVGTPGPSQTVPSTSQSTGAAAQATQAAGILGVAALALLAL